MKMTIFCEYGYLPIELNDPKYVPRIGDTVMFPLDRTDLSYLPKAKYVVVSEVLYNFNEGTISVS